MDLSEKLIEYSDSGIYPMHMPGHKRNSAFFPEINPALIDITEIDGFDNLHNPTEILKDETDRIKRIFGSDESIISVNGSTCAILSAIYASTSDGDTVLMARNCHISVYHAVLLRKLNVIYITPSVDKTTGICNSVSPDEISRAIVQNPQIKLVIITSPTYEGVVSDIKVIADITHKSNIPLLVDEAHGSHFAFSDFFPDSALKYGADMVVQSFHKTLPCFTSNAVIHIKSDIVSAKEIKLAMDIFETSSPSYILLAGISHCMNMLENRKTELFLLYTKRLSEFSEKCKVLKNLQVLCYGNDNTSKHSDYYGFDRSKIVITTCNCNINGIDLYNLLLNKYKIQCEMSSAQYVICMTSVADTDEGFLRLIEALLQIDKTLVRVNSNALFSDLPRCEQTYSVAQVSSMKRVREPISENLISADYIYAYPPGIPLIVPGERFNAQVTDSIEKLKSSNVRIFDSEGEISDKVLVLCIDIESQLI